jgi:hypothetical protein
MATWRPLAVVFSVVLNGCPRARRHERRSTLAAIHPMKHPPRSDSYCELSSRTGGRRRHPLQRRPPASSTAPASDVLLTVHMTVSSSPATAAFYVLHVSTAPATTATDVARVSSVPVRRRSHELCSGIGSQPATDAIPCSDGLRRHPWLQPPTSSTVHVTVRSSAPAVAGNGRFQIQRPPRELRSGSGGLAAADVARTSAAPAQRLRRSCELCFGTGRR